MSPGGSEGGDRVAPSEDATSPVGPGQDGAQQVPNPDTTSPAGPTRDTTSPVAVTTAELDWRSVATVLAAFAGLVLLTALVAAVPRTLAAVVVGAILALGLDPLVSAVERRLRLGRTAAVSAVLAGGVLALSLVVLLVVPPAVRQARALGADAPRVAAELGRLPVVGAQLRDAGVPGRVERAVEELPSRLVRGDSPLVRVGRSAIDGMLAAVATLLFAVTLLLDGGRLVALVRRLVPPAHRARADRLGDLTAQVVGRYVAGSLLVAGVAGLATLVAGLVLGVPLAPLIAAWVALWDLVPQVGGAAGGIPFVALGFTKGAGTGLACAAFFVLYLQLENNVLSPLLVGQALKLSPVATMTAALVGVSAAGVVGALVAVPLAGATKAVYLELRSPDGKTQPEATVDAGLDVGDSIAP